MTCYTLELPRRHPATINQLMHSVRGKIRLNKVDRNMIAGYVMAERIPRAGGKRRLSLYIILGKGQRGADADPYHNSLLEACKHAGLILDDSSRYVELAPMPFSPDPAVWGSVIRLEDL
jgi:hypothetical protein